MCDCDENDGYYEDLAVAAERERWATAFAAYRAALAKPYTHATLPDWEAEVAACFDQLVRLQEGK